MYAFFFVLHWNPKAIELHLNPVDAACTFRRALEDYFDLVEFAGISNFTSLVIGRRSGGHRLDLTIQATKSSRAERIFWSLGRLGYCYI